MSARTRGALAATGGGISAVAVTGLVIGACAAIGALVWWLGVFTSGTAGAGNVTKDQNSSQNRERWSATYSNDMQQIQADQTNLAVLKGAATGPGATVQDRTNYTGARLNCTADVATYNADASNVLGHQWIPAGMPPSIDPSDYCGK
jgi:hypothetical protein